jgi:DNA-binding CsgD family transcriptional regulator
MKICRDDLRYTDDVIATLQSDNPRWYIALALNIPIDDVEYHYEEIRGCTHNGTSLSIAHIDFQDWPADEEWYAKRTRAEIAEQLGKTKKEVIVYIRNHAYTVKKAKTGPKHKPWPTNEKWYKERTNSMIAEELGYSLRAVRDHMVKMGYKSRRIQERYVWPKDPQWYAERSIKDICIELNIFKKTVYHHLRDKGYAYKPTEISNRITWPSASAWYAERTQYEIAEQLGVKINAVRAHIHRNKLPFKRVNQ